MKIDYSSLKGVNANLETQNQASRSRASGIAEAGQTAGTKATLEGDKVKLSQRSRLIARTSEAVAKAPDTRTERVAEIKAGIDAGTYSVKGDLVAESILKSHLREIV